VRIVGPHAHGCHARGGAENGLIALAVLTLAMLQWLSNMR
jgi:hypothetical protein